MRYQANSGFTLIEIAMVSLLLALLAAIAIPYTAACRRTANAKVCADNIHFIISACRAYEIKTGHPTENIDDLVGKNGQGFLKRIPICPAGGTYGLTVDKDTGDVSVTCSKIDAETHDVQL